jgi:hypothetical protein
MFARRIDRIGSTLKWRTIMNELFLVQYLQALQGGEERDG